MNNLTGKIESQRSIVFGEQPQLKLVAPCKMNQGVIKHSENEQTKLRYRFLGAEDKVIYFIPSSGSGSRMFQFLFDFLNDPSSENRSKTERFFSALDTFAFFELVPNDVKTKFEKNEIDLEGFVNFILREEGLNLGSLPKGLIPFHRTRNFIFNPFQEHVVQGMRLRDESTGFHFTINGDFEDKINFSIQVISALMGKKINLSFSEQNTETNAIAFYNDQSEVVQENGDVLQRPAGHGALLENLNAIDADVIFIKNIDNIQHESKSDMSIEAFQYLGGVLAKVKEELLKIFHAEDLKKELIEFNKEYQIFFDETEINDLSVDEIKAILLRPIRVCGMVKNEGQPGGGPFWVSDGGKVTKQIVEKAQIQNTSDQYKLMVQSQYFNPVIMALSKTNVLNEKVDFLNFADFSKYFIVEKKYEGKDIRFVEKPGLWNGSMALWNSIFVEVPSTIFTPVKTVLDLLDPVHSQN